MHIRTDDLTDPQTIALLEYHVAAMRAGSPPGQSFALDLSGLKAPGISVWSLWRGPDIAAIAALKRLGDGSGEIKSMRTHPDHLRQGAGAALLDHVIAVAQTERLTRLSLETGSGPIFEAALALYRSRGFREGPAFGDYVATDFNQFFHLELAP